MPICIHEAPVIWDVALVKQQFERNLCAAHGSDGEIYFSLSRETNVLFVCCWTGKSLAGPRVCHLPGMGRGKLSSLMIIYWIFHSGGRGFVVICCCLVWVVSLKNGARGTVAGKWVINLFLFPPGQGPLWWND